MTIVNDVEGQFVFGTNGQDLVITKNGVIAIDSGFDAVLANGISNTFVDNAGYIYGGLDGLSTTGTMQVTNGVGGEIDGLRGGLRFLVADCRLTNSGTIVGSSGEGVHDEGSGIVVKNSGTISGATGMYINVEGGTGNVVNSGLISGDDTAFYKEGGGQLSFRNSGELDGNVQLFDGTNTFDGRNGTVTGTISGGTGVDTIRLGNDGETVNGGAGHDVIYGGTGADTFAFTSYKPGDADRVRQFDVPKDTIQLARATFTHLVAGAVPTFSIATAATSPTDHLFYNSGTGALSYDADGSGTASSAYVVATMDPGLALTAKNFTVV